MLKASHLKKQPWFVKPMGNSMVYMRKAKNGLQRHLGFHTLATRSVRNMSAKLCSTVPDIGIHQRNRCSSYMARAIVEKLADDLDIDEHNSVSIGESGPQKEKHTHTDKTKSRKRRRYGKQKDRKTRTQTTTGPNNKRFSLPSSLPCC